MEIKNIAFNKIDCIENLWQEFNTYHIKKTRYFTKEFKQKTFIKKKIDLKTRKEVCILGVYKNNELIGYSIITISKENIGEIDNLYIKPTFRKKGLGTLVCKRSLEWLINKNVSDIFIFVAVGNEKALAFYKKLGFYPRNYRLMKTSST